VGFSGSKAKPQQAGAGSTWIVPVSAFRQNVPERARISGLVLQEIPDFKNQKIAVTLSTKQV
jgi:hypothetical protein